MNLQQAIKNNNLIIILGPIASGKSLFLTKQANNYLWKGQVMNSFSIKQEMLDQANIIYLDNLNSLWEEQKNQLISNYLAETKKKAFISGSRIGSLPLEIRERNPLFISTQGLTKQWNWLKWKWEYYLELEYSKDVSWKASKKTKLHITQQDFKFLVKHNKTMRECFLNIRNHINNHHD